MCWIHYQKSLTLGRPQVKKVLLTKCTSSQLLGLVVIERELNSVSDQILKSLKFYGSLTDYREKIDQKAPPAKKPCCPQNDSQKTFSSSQFSSWQLKQLCSLVVYHKSSCLLDTVFTAKK